MQENQREAHLKRLREIYREFWPQRQADHWRPTDGELAMFEYFSRLRREDKKAMDELRWKVCRHLTDHPYAR